MTFSDFFSSLGDLDWVAVLAGTVAMYVFGAIWYGPLFGKKWAAGHGVAGMGGGKMPPPKTMVMGLVSTLVLNIGIAYFVPALHIASQTPSSMETLFVSSFMLGLLVLGAALSSMVIYLNKSWSLWGIDTGYYIVGIAIASYFQDLVA